MKEIKEYENAVENLTIAFAKKYFKDAYEYTKEDWIANQIGGIIFMNDYYFSVDDMVDYMRNKATVKEMFGHCDYIINGYSDLETDMSGKRITFRAYRYLMKSNGKR